MKTLILVNGIIHTGIVTLENCVLLIAKGRISDVMTNERFQRMEIPDDSQLIDVSGAEISPGFIDTHVHGCAGYGTEDKDCQSILKMSEHLAEYGVTSFTPTLYPEKHEDLLGAITAVRDAMGRENGAKILGIHMEGPFFSEQRLGVHRSSVIQSVSIRRMEEYWYASNGSIISMTVAPELKGMRNLALYCSKKGINLQAGHSNANYSEMMDAFQAGIIHTTHMFNAMRPLHHRDPGVTGAVLIQPEISCEIIADGFHVHPELIKMLFKTKPIDKLVLITDALKPTNQKDGIMIANGEEVYFDDGVFKTKKDHVIAGSALTMIDGIKNLCSWGFSLKEAVRMASANPSQVLGLNKSMGTLLPGKRADVTVFDRQFNVIKTIVAGNIVKDSADV